jgi:hypothetical protein
MERKIPHYSTTAALVIMGFGALLLGGYLVNERMVGF